MKRRPDPRPMPRGSALGDSRPWASELKLHAGRRHPDAPPERPRAPQTAEDWAVVEANVRNHWMQHGVDPIQAAQQAMDDVVYLRAAAENMGRDPR